MKRDGITIVELQPSDWRRYLEIKLRSLQQEPTALEDPAAARIKYLQRKPRQWVAILCGHIPGGRSGTSINLFAETANKKLVGMVTGIILGDQKPEQLAGRVQNMFVDKNFRGRGIGRMLLTELLQQLRCKGAVYAELCVVTTQTPAVCLYRSLGFRETGQVRRGILRANVFCDEAEMRLSFLSPTT